MKTPNRSTTSSRNYFLIKAFLVVTFSIAVGFFLLKVFNAERAPSGISAAALYAAQLHSTDGKTVRLAQWEGQVMLINFWATWCAPCREEIPLLIETQQSYRSKGLQIVGIAVDSPENIEKFSQQMGMNYAILFDQADGMLLSRRLGNKAAVLPFTALIDRHGRVAFSTTGILTRQEIEREIYKLI